MKKIKFLNFILCFIVLLGVFCFLNLNKVSASTATFNEFEVGMTFPDGFELTVDNSNGVVPSKIYSFAPVGTDNILYSVYLNDVFYSIDVNEDEYGNSIARIGEFWNSEISIWVDVVGGEDVTEWVLVAIDDFGLGLLGSFSEPVQPNYIYQGVYDLLGNLIYGSSENLSTTQVGNLEFISQIIVIFCVLLPFIILLWVINRLFKF